MSIESFPIEDILLNMGGELSKMEAMARRVEDAVASLSPLLGTSKGKTLAALQDLDLLVQTSQDLASFVLVLAASKFEDGEVNIQPALDVLKLARVKASLSGGESDNSVEGNVFLF